MVIFSLERPYVSTLSPVCSKKTTKLADVVFITKNVAYGLKMVSYRASDFASGSVSFRFDISRNTVIQVR